jgi:CTP:molybdopterin cytidylyltransferase MocA
MSRAGVGVLVLAAGDAGRFGSPKQCVHVDGIPLVRRAALAALEVSANVAVVTGANAEAVAPLLHGLPVETVHNADWADGMGTSLACGVRHQAQDPAVRATLICLSDQPLVGAAELRRLIEAHREAPGHIIASDHGVTLGPPCIFPRHFYPALAALRGEDGARRLLAEHATDVRAVAMPEASVDIDTPADLHRLLAEARRRDPAHD